MYNGTCAHTVSSAELVPPHRGMRQRIASVPPFHFLIQVPIGGRKIGGRKEIERKGKERRMKGHFLANPVSIPIRDSNFL